MFFPFLLHKPVLCPCEWPAFPKDCFTAHTPVKYSEKRKKTIQFLFLIFVVVEGIKDLFSLVTLLKFPMCV